MGVSYISSVQFSHSVMSDSETPWTAARQASLSITNSQNLLKLMSVELVMPFNHFILCHPLLLPPSIFPSIRVFSNESVLRIRWPNYWSFSFNISPSSELPGLISFRMDWLDLLAVQGTLKSLLQDFLPSFTRRKWESGWRLETVSTYLQHCQWQALTPGIENCTSFAPILVGFLPDTSGFQQLYCSRGSLGSRGNYKRIPTLLWGGCLHHLPWACLHSLSLFGIHLLFIYLAA